jgi:hypothetical protein
MKKVMFYISSEVLSGHVACKYCLKTKIQGYQALKLHFTLCPVTKCSKKNCTCDLCDPEFSVQSNDGYNIFLNQFSIETYFQMLPTEYWEIEQPHYIILDEDGIFSYEESPPAAAA